MRKAYYILALASLAICSCATDGTFESEGGLQPITFNASLPDMTKAIINNIDDLKGKNMSLYGWTYFEGVPEPAFVINNLPFGYNTITADAWDYAPHQYWLPSAPIYGFSSIYPYDYTRNDETWTPAADPWSDHFHADDVVRNIIANVKPRTVDIDHPLEDVLVSYNAVSRSDYGNTVNLPMEHAFCAFRIRVRNVTDKEQTLSAWHLTGLKDHCDLIATIIGKNADGNSSQVMTRIHDEDFVSLVHAPVGQTADEPYDKITIKEGGVEVGPIKCEDPDLTPNNYKYIVISQRLQETHATTPDLETVKSHYSAYPNYRKNIYWGNDEGKGMNNDHYFMPFAYVKGPVLENTGNQYAITGRSITMPVSASAEYDLYTPAICGKTTTEESGYVLAFPQEIDGLKLYLTSKAAGESSAIQRSISIDWYMDEKIWEPGYKYDYLVTLSSDKISVTLEIAPWENRNIRLE